MLDVAGVAHLFGGEAGLIGEIEARFSALGVTLAFGLADTPRAACALARYSSQRIAPAGLAGKAFARLFHEMPIAALGLDGKPSPPTWRARGLRRIGDLAMRPRAPISARFGAEALVRLDALNGLARESISPRFAAPDFRRRAAVREPDRACRGGHGDARPSRRRSRRDARAADEGGARDRTQPLPRRRRRAPHKGRRRPADQRGARDRAAVRRTIGGRGGGRDRRRLRHRSDAPLLFARRTAGAFAARMGARARGRARRRSGRSARSPERAPGREPRDAADVG